MTIKQIKAAVDAGKTVQWCNPGYTVIKDELGQYLIHCSINDSYMGLTWKDGTTMNGSPEDFYITEEK